MATEILHAPGESPFRTKGNVYKSLFESADVRVAGGRAAVMARIEDPRLTAFFQQSFLAASSYDIFPIVAFGMIGAQINHVSYQEFVRGGAAFTARRDMRGIYKVLLKLASPEMVARRLPRILLQYFNFGFIEGRITSERRYEAKCRGIPRPMIVWFHNIAIGFVPIIMESAGARDVVLKVSPAIVDSEHHGVELVSSNFFVTWS